jgi:hypothetical protein
MREQAKALTTRFLDQIFILLDSVYSGHNKEVIWVVGDGRSGSTWLQEMINYDNKYRYMFEPFHPVTAGEIRDIGYYKYIRPEYKDEAFYNLASRIFSGRFYHPRVIRGGRIHSRKLLIKDIFGNLLIKWVGEYFPRVKKILIMRHPFATALSKQKLRDWEWMTEPVQFFEQPELIQDWLKPFEALIRNTEGFFERQVLIWSIVHYIPLRQLDRRDIHLIFYEQLCSHPEDELKRLLSFLYDVDGTQDLNPKLLKKIKEPSFTSRRDSAIKRGGNLCDVWRKALSDSQISEGMEILRAFGLDRIYNESLMPDRQAAESILKEPLISR